MLSFFLRRFMYMVVLLVALSMFVWVIIQLPPGDYATTYIEQMRLQGTELSQEEIANFKRLYGLDLPLYRQYV